MDDHILTTVINKIGLPKAEQLQLHTKHMIRLPISLGGIGVASLASTSPPAFLASVCLAMPAIHNTLIPTGRYMASLHHSHATILSPNTGVVACDQIPRTVPALVTTYSKPTPYADQLQHRIQQQASKHVHRALLASFTTNAQRAALISASAPHAGIPLTCVPHIDHPNRAMPNTTFNQYIRMRLQLPPHDNNRLVCNVLQCGTRLPTTHDQVHHHQVCRNMTSREATIRHNYVLNTVLRLARDAGFATAKEEPVRDEHGQKLRPDAIITSTISVHRLLYLDVSVVHPAAKSYSAQSAFVQKPLAAATTREKRKHRLYDAVARTDQAVFIPLVIESYGAFGREFVGFLSSLASVAAEYHGFDEKEMKDWMRDARRDIVFALQGGNALMALHTFRPAGFNFESMH
jgi:hypothetical protein